VQAFRQSQFQKLKTSSFAFGSGEKNTRDNEFFGFFYDGLQNMPQALHSLLNNNTYKEILLASGGVQVVFLSFLCCPFYLHFLPGFKIVAFTLDLLFPPSQDLTI
jgi:hypothetical protein